MPAGQTHSVRRAGPMPQSQTNLPAANTRRAPLPQPDICLHFRDLLCPRDTAVLRRVRGTKALTRLLGPPWQKTEGEEYLGSRFCQTCLVFCPQLRARLIKLLALTPLFIKGQSSCKSKREVSCGSSKMLSAEASGALLALLGLAWCGASSSAHRQGLFPKNN